MNILPKKRWHVRTRENIARVRKDEALAAEEEKKRQERILLAEKEARTELLRSKARQQYGYIPPKKEEVEPDVQGQGESSCGHINLFYELERNETVSKKTNIEHEKEAKEEREKEEMKIGYLTYLGQDTNELTGNVSWYNKDPKKVPNDDREIGLKEKLLADPLKDIRKYLGTEGIRSITDTKVTASSASISGSIKEKKSKKKKHVKKRKKKNRKRSSSSSSGEDRKRKKSSIDINKLREERLRREKVEREKAAAALAKLLGPELEKKSTSPPVEFVQKYSSQFNPHLARQNFE